MYAIFVPAFCLCYWGTRAIKKHITYPRTGYVAYRRDPRSWTLAIIVALAVAAGTTAAVAFAMRLGERYSAVNLFRLAMLSVGVATYAFFALAMFRERRWKWLVVLFMALGSVAISFAGWDRGGFDIHSAHPAARSGKRMNEQLRNIFGLDRVIHEPGRLIIVALLSAVEECDFVYLLHETGLNKGNLSSHMARLEEAGYVEIKKTFRGKVPRTLVRLTRTGRAAFKQYRKKLKEAL